jgi:hypothetical protein
MCRCVGSLQTDVSDEHVSIFKKEEITRVRELDGSYRHPADGGDTLLRNVGLQ